MQAVILAAGSGTRLHPVTVDRTKAMAPILGKPIVERVMAPLIECGIHEFVVVINPDDAEIQRYFENSANVCLVPQPRAKGMGHALLEAAPFIRDDFILSSCDNLVETGDLSRLLDLWREAGCDAILSLLQVGPKELTRMGVVAFDGVHVTRIVEKPTLAEAPSNLGSVPLYLFRHELLELLPAVPLSGRGEYELQDAIQRLIEQGGNVRGFELRSRMDLTTPEDLLSINRHFLQQQRLDRRVGCETSGRDTTFSPPVFIERGVTIGDRSVIGPNVYIEHDCTIGKDVKIDNTVVLRGSQIPAGAVFSGKVVV